MKRDFEKISFTIWNYDTFCRIEANDCRTDIRKLADGACIFDMNVLLGELDRINNELEKINAVPVFMIASSSYKGGAYAV